jgi:hypothetical protein
MDEEVIQGLLILLLRLSTMRILPKVTVHIKKAIWGIALTFPPTTPPKKKKKIQGKKQRF